MATKEELLAREAEARDILKMRGSSTMPRVLQVFRDERDWSQSRLARESGVLQSTISRIEDGQRSTMDARRKIAATLGVTLDDIAEFVIAPYLSDYEVSTAKQNGHSVDEAQAASSV